MKSDPAPTSDQSQAAQLPNAKVHLESTDGCSQTRHLPGLRPRQPHPPLWHSNSMSVSCQSCSPVGSHALSTCLLRCTLPRCPTLADSCRSNPFQIEKTSPEKSISIAASFHKGVGGMPATGKSLSPCGWLSLSFLLCSL